MSTLNANTNAKSLKKNIRFEHELAEAIEDHKDSLIPFAAWVKQACREKLERETTVRTPLGDEVMEDTIKIQLEVMKSDSSPSNTDNVRAHDSKNMMDDRKLLMNFIKEMKGEGQSSANIAKIFNDKGYLTRQLKSWKKSDIERFWQD